MVDLFSAVKFWEAGPLAPVQGSKKIFEREIAGNRFQFRKASIRDRRRMAQKATGHVKHFLGVLYAGLEGGQKGLIGEDGAPVLSSETWPEWMEIVQRAAPAVLDGIADDALNDFIESLVDQAFFWDGAQFRELSNDEIADVAFDDDLTLTYAVALTVLEVNTSAGFFTKLTSALPSATSGTNGSESS